MIKTFPLLDLHVVWQNLLILADIGGVFLLKRGWKKTVWQKMILGSCRFGDKE
jgi:hypothetical protein